MLKIEPEIEKYFISGEPSPSKARLGLQLVKEAPYRKLKLSPLAGYKFYF
jgi:hypothetical protein